MGYWIVGLNDMARFFELEKEEITVEEFLGDGFGRVSLFYDEKQKCRLPANNNPNWLLQDWEDQKKSYTYPYSSLTSRQLRYVFPVGKNIEDVKEILNAMYLEYDLVKKDAVIPDDWTEYYANFDSQITLGLNEFLDGYPELGKDKTKLKLRFNSEGKLIQIVINNTVQEY